MDGDGFDLWSSQPSASGPARAGLDLNSQAPAAEGFPGIRLYEDFLQGDDVELIPGCGRGSGLPPYRPPRAGAGDAWVTPTPQHARQLLFGGSSSAAAGRGGGNGGGYTGRSSSGAGGGVWLFIILFERAELRIENLMPVMRMKIITQCLVLRHQHGQKMNLLLKM